MAIQFILTRLHRLLAVEAVAGAIVAVLDAVDIHARIVVFPAPAQNV